MTESRTRFPWAAALLLVSLGAALVVGDARATAPAGPAAPGASYGQELPEGVTMEMVESGREIFVGEGACLTCHGEEGEGTPIGPALAGEEEWIGIDGSYPAIVERVMAGVEEPEEFMMPMLPRGGTQITDDQVEAVAAYVWFISRDK